VAVPAIIVCIGIMGAVSVSRETAFLRLFSWHFYGHFATCTVKRYSTELWVGVINPSRLSITNTKHKQPKLIKAIVAKTTRICFCNLLDTHN